eukprot:TRINITY_DN4881_c0_g1_i2.p1 TRINITY_DN4881_c0_g1~~TRINITY_DN4881_c0_g1_i2.p1  ORF type:complete len:472 (+),score=106.44 TRINITY_DN4881_c0_g1_i2:1790-3205(+)
MKNEKRNSEKFENFLELLGLDPQSFLQEFELPWKFGNTQKFVRWIPLYKTTNELIQQCTVSVIFSDSSRPFDASSLDLLSGCQSFIVVVPCANGYRLGEVHSNKIQSYKPVIPKNYVFERDCLKEFLLVKAYNAQIAARSHPLVATLFEMPRALSVNQFVEKHCGQNWLNLTNRRLVMNSSSNSKTNTQGISEASSIQTSKSETVGSKSETVGSKSEHWSTRSDLICPGSEQDTTESETEKKRFSLKPSIKAFPIQRSRASSFVNTSVDETKSTSKMCRKIGRNASKYILTVENSGSTNTDNTSETVPDTDTIPEVQQSPSNYKIGDTTTKTTTDNSTDIITNSINPISTNNTTTTTPSTSSPRPNSPTNNTTTTSSPSLTSPHMLSNSFAPLKPLSTQISTISSPFFLPSKSIRSVDSPPSTISTFGSSSSNQVGNVIHESFLDFISTSRIIVLYEYKHSRRTQQQGEES